MTKRKVLSGLFVMTLVICFMLIGTAGVHAASNGGKVLVKKRTVTIKPGKTYKTPVFKLSKKMAFQIPIEIWLSPKDKKKPSYIKKGGYKITLKTAKGKKKASFSDSLKYCDDRFDNWYDTWLYFYDNKPSNPGFAKGKYYYTIRNTTNRIIRVKYSIIGYTEIASKADFPADLDLENGYEYTLGKVGPGIPLVEYIKCDNPAIDVSWWFISYLGKITFAADIETQTETGIMTIKLKNNPEPYKINLTVTDKYWDWDDEN